VDIYPIMVIYSAQVPRSENRGIFHRERFTTEHAEVAEEILAANICVLGALCGELLFSAVIVLHEVLRERRAALPPFVGTALAQAFNP